MLQGTNQCVRCRLTPHARRVIRRDQVHGFQLYQSDPSGNFGGWKATAVGANHQAASNILKTDYKEECSLEVRVPDASPGTTVRWVPPLGALACLTPATASAGKRLGVAESRLAARRELTALVATVASRVAPPAFILIIFKL